MIGVVALLAVVGIRRDLGGATGGDAATMLTVGQSLVTARDYTFLLGPNLAVLYKSRLVPRFIPAMGLLAAPLLIAPTVATLLGAIEHGSIWWAPGGALIFVWELTVGLYMTFKGFKPSPLTATPQQS
jgi:hypothetical protein